MRETSKYFKIYVTNEFAPFLCVLSAEFKNNQLLKKFSQKIVADKFSGESCLNICCEKCTAPFVRTILIETFIECFVRVYKFNYLNDRIKLNFLKKEERESLIKALTYFDLNIDRQLIFNALKNFKDTLFVESFLKFNLSTLEKRWLELCALANDNSAHFTTNQTFLELLKFFIGNLQGETNLVELKILDDKIVLTTEKVKKQFSKNENDLNIVTTLISMMPKKIKVKLNKNSVSSSAIALVCKLFEDKVEL